MKWQKRRVNAGNSASELFAAFTEVALAAKVASIPRKPWSASVLLDRSHLIDQ